MILSTHHKTQTPSDCSCDLNTISFPNGLTLVHQHIPSSSVVVADVWVNAGVTTEPESWSGISHFLEHMIFKGTKNILPGDFDYVVESTGGLANAATSYDYTHFFLTTASQYLPDTLPYLAEIILQAEIPDEDFYIERDVVLEEIRSSYDDYDWMILQSVASSIYRNHPYRKSVLGDECLLLQHTPNQMRCYHKTHYQPENMTVVLVGNIDQQTSISLVENCFQDFSVRSECPVVDFDCEPPMIDIRRQELFLPRLEQPRLVMGWSGPGIENLEGAIALDMLSLILTGGRTSRLVRKLREEEHLLLDISCDFSLQKYSSLFTISAYLSGNNLEQIEAIIRDNIYRLQKEPITSHELRICQRSLCHDYIFSTETPEQLAGLYGYYQILKKADLALQYPYIVKQLTAEKLQAYASQYLSPEYYAICEIKSC
ncbi:pitrilysin family protein [Geminocystis sp. GBBB08]|uniref:M16 family metallopeptidase n=1 Tax=Geminocystis sp. GBBB08 TaxID=2604140 RepID=UPI0027E35C49|nr:pitrilysin family protein [Geminocystis sp. GBBB08]MBL1210621.1 insulinase family protein [Geminocystis sp. GBBB08]